MAVFMCKLFGEQNLVVRSGSVFAFALYTWGAWRTGEHVRDRLVRWCFWCALLACPFLLDLFSLFRGYAIEMAGWLVAIDAVIRYSSSHASKHLLTGLLGLVLANAAIVALVPAWGVVLLLLVLLLITHWKHLSNTQRTQQCVAMITLGLLPMWYAAGIALELKRQGLLYYGSTDGFMAVTVSTLCQYVLGSAQVLIVASVTGIICVSTIINLVQAKQTKNWTSAAMIICILLWADVIMRIAMAAMLGVNFPEDRAGIHFVPLVLLCVAFTADTLAQQRALWRWASVILLALPVRTIITANLDHTLLWPEQSVPLRFVDRVLALQAASARPFLIGGHHQLALAWPMNASLHGVSVPSLQTARFPEGDHDLRIVDSRFLLKASIGFHAIDSSRGPGLWLLQRNTPLIISPVSNFHTPALVSTDEFVELAHLPDPLIRSEKLMIDLRMTLGTDPVSPDVLLVVEVSDSAGTKLLYDAVQVAVLQRISGGALVFTRTLPALPLATRAVFYAYNPRKEQLSLGAATTSVSIVR
ncbi:MAG: hypothetical protein IPP33_16905 [Flavobacteriales bacterium]|nr:hypothetical protein [Flavobacteriales bacterium]